MPIEDSEGRAEPSAIRGVEDGLDLVAPSETPHGNRVRRLVVGRRRVAARDHCRTAVAGDPAMLRHASRRSRSRVTACSVGWGVLAMLPSTSRLMMKS